MTTCHLNPFHQLFIDACREDMWEHVAPRIQKLFADIDEHGSPTKYLPPATPDMGKTVGDILRLLGFEGGVVLQQMPDHDELTNMRKQMRLTSFLCQETEYSQRIDQLTLEYYVYAFGPMSYVPCEGVRSVLNAYLAYALQREWTRMERVARLLDFRRIGYVAGALNGKVVIFTA